MAATNDITGDAIQSRGLLSPEGEAAFDRIFGVKERKRYIPPPLPMNEYPNQDLPVDLNSK